MRAGAVPAAGPTADRATSGPSWPPGTGRPTTAPATALAPGQGKEGHDEAPWATASADEVTPQSPGLPGRPGIRGREHHSPDRGPVSLQIARTDPSRGVLDLTSAGGDLCPPGLGSSLGAGVLEPPGGLRVVSPPPKGLRIGARRREGRPARARMARQAYSGGADRRKGTYGAKPGGCGDRPWRDSHDGRSIECACVPIFGTLGPGGPSRVA
jgi:hypothetical protein